MHGASEHIVHRSNVLVVTYTEQNALFSLGQEYDQLREANRCLSAVARVED